MRGGVRERFPKLTEHGMTMARALGSYLRWAPNKGILSIFRKGRKYALLIQFQSYSQLGGLYSYSLLLWVGDLTGPFLKVNLKLI